MISFDDARHVVLITGATGGIGECYCHEFAKRDYPLAISGRRKAELEALADKLSAQYGIQVWAFPADLSEPEGPQQLWQDVKDAGLIVEILVNNAALLRNEALQESTVPVNNAMLAVNVQALTTLTTLAVQDMLQHGHGHVINMSSTAGWIAMPEESIYAASKMYVRQLTLAVSNELRARKEPVGVTAVCPNWVDTKMMNNPSQGKRLKVPRFLFLTPEKVARDAVEGALSGKVLVIPGKIWEASMVLVKMLPIRLVTMIFGASYRLIADNPQ